MGFDDRLTLRDGIEDLRDTMRDIIPNDILDEQRRQGDTDGRRDEVPPGTPVSYQLAFHQLLNQMNETLEQTRSQRSEQSYEEGEKQHQMLLTDMTFPPFY